MAGSETPRPESPLSPRRCGLIGIGAIGEGVGLCLRRAAVPLTVHGRHPERASALLAAGADWAESPREVARAVDGGVILLALPEAKEVQRVLFGRRGVVAGARAGSLVVDLSTLAPDQSRDLAARLGERAIPYIDVPVGGSREVAREGRLLLYVGGSDGEFLRAEPYLRCFSRGIERVGPVGSGSAMKLANNLITISTLALVGEALSLAESQGIRRDRALEILLEGGARSAMLENKHELLLRSDYSPRFRLALALKDLRLVDRAFRAGGRAAPVAHQARRVYERASDEGRGELDFSAVVESVREFGQRARPPAEQPAPRGTGTPPPSPSPPRDPATAARSDPRDRDRPRLPHRFRRAARVRMRGAPAPRRPARGA